MRWLLLTVTVVLTAPLSAFAQNRAEDEAGDVSEVDKDSSGPLRDRIPPVSGHVFLMDGRFELSPEIGVSLRDAFFTKYFFGAALTYHFTETLGISVRGGYTASIISGAAQICPSPSTIVQACRAPTLDELTKNGGTPANRAYGLTTFMGSIDFQWAPIYGKLSLISEKVLHFNTYLLAGPAIVSYGPVGTITVGGNIGVGFRFVMNKWLALRLELRDVIYYEQGYPASNTSVRNQLMAGAGLSMFFPTVFQETR